MNLEVAVQSVKEHGDSIIQETGKELPGLMAWFADPSGNEFGLFQQAM